MQPRPISPAKSSSPFNPLLTKAKSYSPTTQPFAPLPKAKSCSTLSAATATATATATANSLPKAKSYSTTTQPFHPKNSTKTHLSNLELLLQKQPSQSTTTTTTLPPPPSNFPPPKPTTSTTTNDKHQLFNALNLSNLFPRRPPEEMSPRSLGNLSRLLSESPRPSPRNPIASRWRQFHGANDWSGLLDPLNEDLRRELVRYGDLVQSSYQAFFHPCNPTATPAQDRPVPLPDRSYRVVRGLFATSSIDMPKWVPGATQRSSWIGYVAVCDSEKEIRRVGRRDIVVALRGTATSLEWAENLRAGMVSIEEDNVPDQQQKSTRRKSTLSQLFRAAAAATRNKTPPTPKVERGFWSLYKTPGADVPSLSAAVVEEIKRLMEQYRGEELSITITGHSLGAALAVLVADELAACAPRMPPIAVFSFGGPRVGNRGFADRVEERGVKVLRVVNAHDVVPRVPGVLPQLPEGVGDGYAHVGRELRVDSRLSPYLKPNADPACCHDLEAYLHLVDGFLASNCPFRSNAKRSLARLLNQQGSNLKQKYMVQGSIMMQKYVSKVGKLELDPVEPVGFNVSGYIASPSS